MIVAGIGCRKGVDVAEVLAAVETALETHGLALTALSALATTTVKRDEIAIVLAGAKLDLPLILVDAAATGQSTPTLTRSEHSQAAAGTPSVSETSALLAAGAGARLAGPRIVVGNVTCAIAFGGDAA